MTFSDYPHQPGDEDSIWEEELGIVTCAKCGCKFEISKNLTNIEGAAYVCPGIFYQGDYLVECPFYIRSVRM